jgi:hypothetical protein
MHLRIICLICFLVIRSHPLLSSAPDQGGTLSLHPRYTLEAEDPLHRPADFLALPYNLWLSQWQEGFVNFWDFIDQERQFLQDDFPLLYDPEYRIAWLNDEERGEYEASLHQADDNRISVWAARDEVLPDGKWLYVHMDDKLYVGKERKYRFHHVSLSGGRNVNAAGTLTIKNGALVTLSFISGHYRPSIAQGQRWLSQLCHQHGLDLSGLKIAYYSVENGDLIKKKSPLEEFLGIDGSMISEVPVQTPFLVPFSGEFTFTAQKADLLLNDQGELFASSPKFPPNDPLYQALGPIKAKASVKLKEGRIAKILYKTPVDNVKAVESLRWLVEALIRNGAELDGIPIRIIKDHEKLFITAQDLFE